MLQVGGYVFSESCLSTLRRPQAETSGWFLGIWSFGFSPAKVARIEFVGQPSSFYLGRGATLRAKLHGRSGAVLRVRLYLPPWEVVLTWEVVFLVLAQLSSFNQAKKAPGEDVLHFCSRRVVLLGSCSPPLHSPSCLETTCRGG